MTGVSLSRKLAVAHHGDLGVPGHLTEVEVRCSAFGSCLTRKGSRTRLVSSIRTDAAIFRRFAIRAEASPGLSFG